MSKTHNISDYQEESRLYFSLKKNPKLLYKAVKKWLESAQKSEARGREYSVSHKDEVQ
jgi:hypothetical protein